MTPEKEKAIRAAAEAEYKTLCVVQQLEAQNQPETQDERVKLAQDLAFSRALHQEALLLLYKASEP